MSPVILQEGAGRVQLLLASFLTALLLFVGMPGHVGWWPVLFVALVPLLAFVTVAGPRQSFTAGLLAGLLYHASMLYWIVFVLGRYGGLPPLLSIPAMLLLSAYMAVYPALFCLIISSSITGRCNSGTLLFLAPSVWVGLDWLRSILFTGFPWMDLGYGLAFQPYCLQVADLGGHHLVTFVIILINALIMYGVNRFRKGPGMSGRSNAFAASAALCFLLLCGGYSVVRMQQVDRLTLGGSYMNVGVVQGNVDQLLKWAPDQKRLTLEKYLDLTEGILKGSGADVLVWPETALPFFPGNDPLFSAVLQWADSNNVWLLTGAPHFEMAGTSQLTRNPIRYYNSAQLIDRSGQVAGWYAKRHLVPFGEYVPLRKLLFFLEPLVESVGNFTVGRSGAPLQVQSEKMGVLICYESIFPGLARKQVAAGADFLVNITNDAWYGRSSAPFQSFSMAILRAVETRRSMIRAANTGISGFVFPSGRVVKQSPIFEPLALSSPVPVGKVQTVFTRGGYLFAPACVLFALVSLVVCRRKK